MTRFIGVRGVCSQADLKRDLLLFDQIVLTFPEMVFGDRAAVHADLQYLQDAGCLRAVSQEEVDSARKAFPEVADAVTMAGALAFSGMGGIDIRGSAPEEVGWMIRAGLMSFFKLHARLVSMWLERQTHDRVTPLDPPAAGSAEEWYFIPHWRRAYKGVLELVEQDPTAYEEAVSGLKIEPDLEQVRPLIRRAPGMFAWAAERVSHELRTGRLTLGTEIGDAVEVTLRQMPFLDDGVPLEDVVVFAADPEFRLDRLRLRRWVLSLAGGGMGQREIEEELEWLLETYKKHMVMTGLAEKPGVVEALITVPAGVLEDLVKLKWSNAAKRLFSVRRLRVPMLVAEETAPGREVAFVSRAQERFSV